MSNKFQSELFIGEHTAANFYYQKIQAIFYGEPPRSDSNGAWSHDPANPQRIGRGRQGRAFVATNTKQL
jgi:hypothetical protein